MIVISVIRKGASKRLMLSIEKTYHLSLLQIFESTDDVVNYQVAELDNNYKATDRYLPNMQGFSKWIPISVSE